MLFEGGAGETVRGRLLEQYDVHTLLRLPTGIFYAQGVKANVLFFDRKPASTTPWTERSGSTTSGPTSTSPCPQPLDREGPGGLPRLLHPGARHDRAETERFKAFEYDELIERDKTNLDIFWLKDDSLEDTENLPAPDVLAADIVENLGAALEQFRGIQEELTETAVEANAKGATNVEA